MGKERVRVNILNWDVEAYYDLINGTGFICNEPGQIDIDGEKKKTMNGPQSPRFGSTYGDEHEFIERYRCDCGTFKGKMFNGETCPLCNTKVRFMDVDIKQTAWVPLGKNKIINPYYYNLLVKLIGKKVFPDIVDIKQRVDVNGQVSSVVSDEIENPSSPFVGMGISNFMENFDEVIDYFKVKKKDKADQLEKLKKIKSKVFTSFIPIYTTVLRPQSSTPDTLYYTGIDKEINPLIKLSLDIVDCEDIEKPLILSKIQKRANNMWDYNFSLITSKDGFIRDKLIGGSLNYSARNVIIPDPSLKVNELDMSYQTFRILFSNLIMYYLMKQDHIPLWKAYDRWKRSYVYDNYIYEVMKFIVDKRKPMVLLNRNPTLNYYSMLLMSIRQVKPDDTDYTLSVGLSILGGLNADFDGDILNMFAVMIPELQKLFRKFNPTERMIIDRATGLLNTYFAVSKGQLIDLSHFATL